jgi:integrase/recombinase XerD
MSPLASRAEEYLRLRGALGHKLDDAHRLLPRFVAYLDAAGIQTITVEAALAWAQRFDADPATTVWARRMTVARGFARHMAGIDRHTQTPPVGLIPYRQRWRQPFIYSTADIAALMAQTHAGAPIRSPFRAATVQTLIGLLAATGMRVGEAIALARADVDWTDGVLVVRDAKFGKSRQVPLHASTMDALAAHALVRDRHQPRPETATFFVSNVGRRLIYADLQQTFRNLVSAAGVGAGSRLRPRLHDLRHSFAVATLLDWYRTGEDVQARLPRLATYLGHRDPRSTYWYLSAAPELLALAADRLQALQEANP